MSGSNVPVFACSIITDKQGFVVIVHMKVKCMMGMVYSAWQQCAVIKMNIFPPCLYNICINICRGSRGLMLESWTRNPKVVSSSLRSGRDCRWGVWISSALCTLNNTTEVPLSKAPDPQLLPRSRVCIHGVCVCSRCVCVCVFTAVCVCTLDGLNAENKFRV